MKRALASVFLAALVVLGLPAPSQAADNPVIVSSPSTSYSGQPRPFSIDVFNQLLVPTRLTATITNSGTGTRALSCRAKGAGGVGAWTCTLAGGRLGIGSVSVTVKATPRAGGKTRTSSRSGTVSSRFAITNHTAQVNEGGTFTVSGRRDFLSGSNDYAIRASVTGGGSVAGCSTSGGSYTCTLRAAASISGTTDTHRVTVTQSGPGGSRSASTTTTVIGEGAPTAPRFTTAPIIKFKSQPATITGTTSAGGLQVQVLVDPGGSRNWSSPAATCTTTGSGGFACPLSQSLKAGAHTIVARVLDPSDPSKVSPEASTSLQVQKPPKAPAPEEPPITASPSPVLPTEEPPAPPVTEPDPEPVATDDEEISGTLDGLFELFVLALAVLTLARPGALSRLRPSSSAAFTDRNPAPAPADDAAEPVGWGDQSPTWAAFGTDATDYWSREAPPKIAPHSPFLARLSIDGVAIRAMFGSLWWLLPIAGVVLGAMAASDTGFKAVPPSLGLLAAILVIGCFDALAGFLASLVFAVCVVGDLDKHGFAVVIALGFLWTALPLVAALLRPIRRTGRGWTYRWDRLADLVIGALVCGWIAHRITDGLDAIAGAPTGAPADASTVATLAVAAIAGRVLLGHLVDLGWPERLRATEIFEELPEPRTYAVVLGFVVRTALLGLVGYALLGSCWQLWVGLFLLVLPDLLAALRSRSALAPTLRTGLPAGVTEILVLVVWGSLLVGFAIAQGDGDLAKVRWAFLAAAVLPSVFGLGQVLADPDQERPATSWKLQLVGAAIVVGTAALALHGWNY